MRQRNKRTFFLAEKSCAVHHTETVLTLAAVVVAVALCRCRRRCCRRVAHGLLL